MMSRKWGATWNRLDTRLVARWQVIIIIDDRCGNWTYSQSDNHTGLDWIWRTKGCLVGSVVGGWVVDLVFCGWVWEILNKIALQFILNKPMAVAAGVNNSARQRVYSIISGVLARWLCRLWAAPAEVYPVIHSIVAWSVYSVRPATASSSKV